MNPGTGEASGLPGSALNGWHPGWGSFAERLQPLKLQVSAVQTPLVVPLQQHGAHQARDGGVIGEDAHHVGAASDLGVEPLQRVGAVDLLRISVIVGITSTTTPSTNQRQMGARGRMSRSKPRARSCCSSA